MKIKNIIIGVITSIVLINCGMSVLATGFDINADNKIEACLPIERRRWVASIIMIKAIVTAKMNNGELKLS